GSLTFDDNVEPWNRVYAGAITSFNIRGEIIGCKNYGNIIGCFASGGICAINYGTIKNCTNYGDILSPQDVMLDDDVTEYPTGGIYAITEFSPNNDIIYVTNIENCINYGRINAGKLYSGGGIAGGGSVNPNVPLNTQEDIKNCTNYGEIIGGKILGGILGKASKGSSISSCFNAGQVASATSSGGIVGTIYDTAHISNCLDVSGMHIMIDHWEVTGDSISNMSSNYYDRQMSGGSGEDIEGETEGRFTSQLTGDTPELRAMLGDGWSYAEGRYPIPLGLENDSLAMLFATPIHLRVISDDNYDHTNLVRNNFTVGTENGVSWTSGNRLSINGENATILASGSETATASLAGYSFSRSLRLDPITGELVATDCDSYEWNGDEYTASGDYIQVLTAANGCDSIVTLHLTINNSVHYSFTETATSPYTWNGTEYTETGDYTQNFTAANGCDSIVTLHLNILSGISQNGTAEISIYTNPATSTVSISGDNFSRATVIDLGGKVVMEVYDTTFNIGTLRNGEYIVKVVSLDGAIQYLKLIKR
ncbi:MAG: T9SS type A sorting domain-containing protein, partial [Bacteroidales bacterium]|nr:T9SS type A sorting domain-containing protein [Bacteroidales bacterium]